MVPSMWGNIGSPEYGIPSAVGEDGDVVGITAVWYPPCGEILAHLSMEFLTSVWNFSPAYGILHLSMKFLEH